MCHIDVKECIPKAVVGFFLKSCLETKNEKIACEI